jgi:hypothetical protein
VRRGCRGPGWLPAWAAGQPAGPGRLADRAAGSRVRRLDPAVTMPSAAAVLSAVAGTVPQGRVVARETGRLARELLRISVGSSSVVPAKGDWRFADPTWTENPVYRRIGQAYLAFSGSMDRLADEAEKTGKDPNQARFAVTLLTSAMAPTNFWLGNSRGDQADPRDRWPQPAPRAAQLGRRSPAQRRPALDGRPAGLQVGRDLALTPGAVVERDEVAELIQYTSSHRQRPRAPAAGRPAADRPVLLPRPAAPGAAYSRAFARRLGNATEDTVLRSSNGPDERDCSGTERRVSARKLRRRRWRCVMGAADRRRRDRRLCPCQLRAGELCAVRGEARF